MRECPKCGYKLSVRVKKPLHDFDFTSAVISPVIVGGLVSFFDLWVGAAVTGVLMFSAFADQLNFHLFSILDKDINVPIARFINYELRNAVLEPFGVKKKVRPSAKKPAVKSAPVKKKSPAKKKAPAKKKPATKKPVEKKKAPAKNKPAAEKAPVKKKSPAKKKSTAKKKPVKKAVKKK